MYDPRGRIVAANIKKSIISKANGDLKMKDPSGAPPASASPASPPSPASPATPLSSPVSAPSEAMPVPVQVPPPPSFKPSTSSSMASPNGSESEDFIEATFDEPPPPRAIGKKIGETESGHPVFDHYKEIPSNPEVPRRRSWDEPEPDPTPRSMDERLKQHDSSALDFDIAPELEEWFWDQAHNSRQEAQDLWDMGQQENGDFANKESYDHADAAENISHWIEVERERRKREEKKPDMGLLSAPGRGEFSFNYKGPKGFGILIKGN